MHCVENWVPHAAPPPLQPAMPPLPQVLVEGKGCSSAGGDVSISEELGAPSHGAEWGGILFSSWVALPCHCWATPTL